MPEPTRAERVDAAFAACPRTRHLPPSQVEQAGLDRALPIGYGQTNSQPTTVRDMLLALDVRAGQRVLDVGSGSGWTTVLLAHLVGPTGRVVGIERVPELVAMGAAAVAQAGMPWASVQAATPGVLGDPSGAPYDRILVSAMADGIPQQLRAQLTPDGVLVVPANGVLWRVDRDRELALGRYLFVPLVPD